MANNVVVPYEGMVNFLKLALVESTNRFATGNNAVALYTSITGGLSLSTVFADMVEPSFTGYAAAGFTTPVIGTPDARNQIPITFDPVSFQPTSGSGLPVTVLGWFAILGPTPKLLWVQPFSSPFIFTSTSSICTFTPTVEDGQLPIP